MPEFSLVSVHHQGPRFKDKYILIEITIQDRAVNERKFKKKTNLSDAAI